MVVVVTGRSNSCLSFAVSFSGLLLHLLRIDPKSHPQQKLKGQEVTTGYVRAAAVAAAWDGGGGCGWFFAFTSLGF